MTDTPQQKAILRQSKTARRVRRDYPAGTRVVAVRGVGVPPAPGAWHGTVLRHVPTSNAQGGHLVVQWDNNSHVGRVNPCAVVREENHA